MYFERIRSQVDADVGGVEKVVREILFDHVAFVTKADDEIVHAMGRIQLHDVPQHGHAANLDHWFRPDGSLLAKPGTKSAGENDRFHSGGDIYWPLNRSSTNSV